jgi:hypothetical protein
MNELMEEAKEVDERARKKSGPNTARRTPP